MGRRRAALTVTLATVLVVGATPLTAAGLDEPSVEVTADETTVDETGDELTSTTEDSTDGASGEDTSGTDDGDTPLADPTDDVDETGDLDATTDETVTGLEAELDEATDDDNLLAGLVATLEDPTGTGGDDPDDPDGGGDVEGSGGTDPEPAEEPAGTDDPAASDTPQDPAGPASSGDPSPRTSLDAGPAGSAGRPPVRPADPASSDEAEAAPALPHEVEVIARNEEAGLAYPELRLPDLPGFGQRSPGAPWAWPFDADAYTRHPGQRTTVAIVDELVHLGVEPHVIGNVLAPFPVAGPAAYTDDWAAPRYVPTFHAHQGTDIFAERGTPVVASFDGVITRVYANTAIGGNGLKLAMADGTYVYYAHLDGFAPGVVQGARVAVGTVIGYVGDTGNALGTPPHLHYEIHPRGGGPVPPVPYLDAWLEEARAEVLLLRGPGVDASLLRPAPAPVAPPVTASSPGAAAGATPSSTSALPAAGEGMDSRGLTLLTLWVLVISAGYVLLRRRGVGGAPSPAGAAAAAPARDVLAPLLPSRERGPVRLAA